MTRNILALAIVVTVAMPLPANAGVEIEGKKITGEQLDNMADNSARLMVYAVKCAPIPFRTQELILGFTDGIGGDAVMTPRVAKAVGEHRKLGEAFCDIIRRDLSSML